MKIITLTLSPAVDVEYELNSAFETDGLNRSSKHNVSAGGKGINVSRAIIKASLLNNEPIKDDLLTVAPVGGSVGKMLYDILEKEGIKLYSEESKENTRINVSVIGENGKAAEINAPGASLGDAKQKIEDKILSAVSSGDVVVIAGSCPKDVEKTYPSELIKKLKAVGVITVLDCDGEALKIALNSDSKPDLIKPNGAELSGFSGIKVTDFDTVKIAADKIGVKTVITTLAGDGAVITENGDSKFFKGEKVKPVRLKGAGDTFLGTFVYWRYYKKAEPEVAMKNALDAAGKYVAGK